ncbi:MAG: NADH-quinone oxidoreductase subunit M [Flavobacteriales bacterium]|nr:NADH-quinone oxidoreductase subunit M [Flavobacteriales bacterium]
MQVLILLLIPFVTALLLAVFRPNAAAKTIALVSTFLTLGVALWLWKGFGGIEATYFDHVWIAEWGLNFKLGFDGTGLLMVILTAVIFPFIIATGYKQDLRQPALVNALLLFSQSFMLGVFTAQNAFLFYIFYELSVVPIFFLLLYWGGEGRRVITMRFFIYTLLGGLALLFGIAYLVVNEPTHSADFSALANVALDGNTQTWLFWALFLAFAIKLPIFPFHSWQPETYTMAPLQGTMVLSAVMLKMGIYGTLKFIFPIVPEGAAFWQNTVIWLSVIGAIYAGIIAFRQKDFKRLVAYSSLSHVGILTAGLFAWNTYGISGSLYQTFAHAVLMMAMFYIVGAVQQRSGTSEISAMGGLKLKTPRLAALFLLVLGNAIALPLTQSFIGEWLMFNGLWQLDGGAWMAFGAVSTIVLGAIYMLYVYQRIMLGPDKGHPDMQDADTTDHLFLVPLIAITLILGIYPAPILDLVNGPVQLMINAFPILH